MGMRVRHYRRVGGRDAVSGPAGSDDTKAEGGMHMAGKKGDGKTPLIFIHGARHGGMAPVRSIGGMKNTGEKSIV